MHPLQRWEPVLLRLPLIPLLPIIFFHSSLASAVPKAPIVRLDQFVDRQSLLSTSETRACCIAAFFSMTLSPYSP